MTADDAAREATPDEAHDIGYTKGHIDGYREGRAEALAEQRPDVTQREAVARAIHRMESGGAWDNCGPCYARADAALSALAPVEPCLVDHAKIAPSACPRCGHDPVQPDAPFAITAEHIERQREFSLRTYGPGLRTEGVLDHIAKESEEVRQDPTDVGEWVDIIILGIDGAQRTGADAQEILDALLAKQIRNEGRTWPDWRTAEPGKAIEHDRTDEPVPVQPDPLRAGVEALRREVDRLDRLVANPRAQFDTSEAMDLADAVGESLPRMLRALAETEAPR